ncbi:MAG: nucleotide-binding protein [Ignavibacteria bacterium]|nr:nucleotide-binding protein [Ignavibacteria bacterium]
MDTDIIPQENSPLDTLFEIYFNSLTALQVQDKNNAQNVYFMAKNVYDNLPRNIDEKKKVASKIIMGHIEMTLRWLKASDYMFFENWEKAITELDFVKRKCIELHTLLDFHSDDIFENEDDKFMFKFMTIYFERLGNALYDLTKKTIDISRQKYVDDIQMLLDAANELRKINDQKLMKLDEDRLTIILPLINTLIYLAEVYEEKAYKLVSKRKDIEFMNPIGNKVFIVHGHGEAKLRELKEILIKDFKLEPIILNEQPDKGNTLIEKFEEYGRICNFCFVLLTPDDEISKNNGKYFQPRPNVLFELGWFSGRFGRNKVRILKQGEISIPSDLNGIVTINFHDSISECFRKIKSDLEEAGIIKT